MAKEISSRILKMAVEFPQSSRNKVALHYYHSSLHFSAPCLIIPDLILRLRELESYQEEREDLFCLGVNQGPRDRLWDDQNALH